ncbi:helix-turn-helix domain-containing protein [Actinomadura barringtoniae]|uniref:Helix-turn-helix domain-containing protein n=1 Tax=Actinomadura barringtoniae TaxID=1427535 RepID=A0A939PLC7_9ACTN|nr:helix-turn-helix transcriptional regulator [Actinomadura barringtoniae]MBO2454457.1 helix-turn-helix domain-containing protein [Actinomadura barringtoniae]
MGNIAPTIRLRRLGLALKNARESAGLTLYEAADLLKRHPTSIARIEKGLHHARVRDVEYMLNKYGVTDAAIHERLYDWSRNGRKKGWWQEFRKDLSPETMDLIGLEYDSDSIDFCELVVVPGLFQNEDYARALIAQGPYSGDEESVERLIAVRMQRKEIITRPNPPRLRAIIDEAALHRLVGGRRVMRAQLQHLLDLSSLPNVMLQVLPFACGAHQCVTGAFIIIEIGGPGSLRVVTVDSLTQMSYLEGEDVLRTYSNAFKGMHAKAHSEADTRTFIEGLLSQT